MSMAYIRKTYGVPAKRGGRVEYTGEGRAEYGTIKSANGAHLAIKLDGVKHTMPFHPTTRIIAASIAAAVLAGCASTAQIYSPVIDPKVGDQSRLHDHLAECRALADQVGQADTAVAGALFATAIGAMLGARGSTLAGIALMTGASAAGYAGMTQQQIVQRCLTNRGYAVLD